MLLQFLVLHQRPNPMAHRPLERNIPNALRGETLFRIFVLRSDTHANPIVFDIKVLFIRAVYM